MLGLRVFEYTRILLLLMFTRIVSPYTLQEGNVSLYLEVGDNSLLQNNIHSERLRQIMKSHTIAGNPSGVRNVCSQTLI
jgi:hypothetical protein